MRKPKDPAPNSTDRAIPMFKSFVALCVAVVGASQCTDDLGCSLNGICETLGKCSCRQGWKGEECGILDLAPAPSVEAFHRPLTASWGGGVLFAEGQYHLFVAVMEKHCGLDTWGANSAIYHAVSPTAAGPYVNETVVVPHWAHSPRITQAPDGTYLLWHVGCGNNPDSDLKKGCTNGTTPGTGPPPAPSISSFKEGASMRPAEKTATGGECDRNGMNALSSKSINGPWTPALSLVASAEPFLHSSLDDPAPLHLPNGTTWIVGV
jgi:hypothetical protein